MTWDEIRQQYRHSWVIVEALNAHTQAGQRIVQNLRIIQAFGDWFTAWEYYKQAHHADKNREYYVVHTDREILDIGVINTFGRIIS